MKNILLLSLVLTLKGIRIAADCDSEYKHVCWSSDDHDWVVDPDCAQSKRAVSEIIYNCSYSSDIDEVYKSIDFNYSENDATVGSISVTINSSNIPTLSQQYDWKIVTTFNLHDTQTKTIQPGFFAGFPELETLKITNNQLSNVDFLYGNLQNLTTLVLANNSISSLYDKSFYGKAHLTHIDLSGNFISVLPKNLFQYQEKLTYIDFSRNTLHTIQVALFDQPILKTIILSDNRLTSFDFTSLNNFERLDLSGNQLKSMEPNETLIVDDLNLSRNRFTVIPKELKVRKLSMNFNRIETLDNIFSWEDLQHLDLSYNNITSLGVKDLKNMPNSLKYLNFSHNTIKILPLDAFSNFNYLETLDLSYNRINEISFGHLSHLSNLENLDLSNNMMNIDFSTLLSLLDNLVNLNIQGNNIYKFDYSTFDQLSRLQTLTLADYIQNCSLLASTINKLKKRGITVVRGESTNVTNLRGIACKVDVLKSSDLSVINDYTPEKMYQSNGILICFIIVIILFGYFLFIYSCKSFCYDRPNVRLSSYKEEVQLT